ncbi:MAG: sulfatase [Lentisphaeraceae bacterium]|nr:sulfatase [Lentisphaeraceae bacterium]
MKIFTLIFLLSFSLYAAEKPNIVFVLVDDLGWSDLACYGSKQYETPNLDKLAKTGVRFTDAYAGGSVCSPTRAAIMTGRSPSRLRITDWIPGQKPKGMKLLCPKIHDELPLKEVTMAETFKENGYETAYVGKWHLGGDGFLPTDQGFDENIGGFHRGSPPGGYYSPYKNPYLKDGPEGEYLPDRLTEESIKFIERKKDGKKPFFLYLSYYTVHTPIQASKRHIEHYQKKMSSISKLSPISERLGRTLASQSNPAYASMVTAMDENIGRLVDKINEFGLDKNTIIVFTSDNGGLSTKKTPGPTSNLPLRAGKGWCYEGGIRVPLIIRAPGVKSTEISTPVISMDYFPTLLELAGITLKPDLHVDGVSLVGELKNGKKVNRDSLVWHYPHYHGSTWRPGASIRSGKWKMIEFFETGEKELYDLSKDLEESQNLASKYPEVLKEMTLKMERWRVANNAEMPRLNPNFKKK